MGSYYLDSGLAPEEDHGQVKVEYLGRGWCPSSCKLHWWWEWYSKGGKPAKPHRSGITILGAAWYWGKTVGKGC